MDARCDRQTWERIKHSPMAKTEPDPGLAARLKQLRQEAGLGEIRKKSERLRREPPQDKERPTKKPKG